MRFRQIAYTMKRFIFICLALLFIVCMGIARLRTSPWARSHFAIATGHVSATDPDSLRKSKYYNATLSETVDSIYVIKHLREMYVFHNGALQKIYRFSLGDAPVGHKHFQGDEKTPEGLYFIDGKNPYSSCHKNLGISYPNNTDRDYAHRNGKPSGGDIKIHGLPNGQGYIGKAHLLSDWTNGCIGITDEEIDELYANTGTGIPIFIVP